MKKPYSLSLIFVIGMAAFFFVSCSKSSQSPKTASIVGKWNITADTSQTVGYAPYIIVGINSPYMQFNADGTGTEKDNISLPDVILNFTYSQSNNTITFNFPDQPKLPGGNNYTVTVKTATSNKMIFEADINDPNITVKELIYLSR